MDQLSSPPGPASKRRKIEKKNDGGHRLKGEKADQQSSSSRITLELDSSISKHIDAGFSSSQLHIFGHDGMQKIAASHILISGLGGLGIEVAKNLVLGGVRSLTLHDTSLCQWSDLSSQIYLTEADIGMNRAEASLLKLSNLNPHVTIKAANSSKLTDEDFLKSFGVVVLTNSTLEEQLEVAQIVRRLGHALIVAQTRGLFAQMFCDFGPESNFDFKPLDQALNEPDFVTTDPSKLEQSAQLHLAFRALDSFQIQKKESPQIWMRPDSRSFVTIAEEVNRQVPDGPAKVEIIDKELLATFAHVCRGALSPIDVTIGGVVALEIMKACTRLFTPIVQWLYFDAIECLPRPSDHLLSINQCRPKGTRYDGQVAVFGDQFQRELGSKHYFVVGAGAINRELVTILAMMGVGCSKNGHVSLANDDCIEESSLDQKFIVRKDSQSKMECTTTAAAAKEFNPNMNVTAFTHHLDSKTESAFDERFFRKLDGVVIAVENDDSRLFMDRRCVSYSKSLINLRAFGTRGHVQLVIPRLTQSYSSAGLIADDLTPPIAATTSIVAGLASIELLKLAQGHAYRERYKNSFIDVASPFLELSNPVIHPERMARDVLYRVIRIQCCNRIWPGERTPASCQMSYEFQVGISVPESLSSKASEREINRLESEFNAWGGQDMVTAHLDEYYDDPTITFPMLTHLQPNKSVHIDSLPLHSVALLAYICSSSGYLDLLMENDIARRVILSFVLAVTDKYRRGLMTSEDATLLAYLPFDIFQAFFTNILLEGIINNTGPIDTEIGAELRQQAVIKGGFKLILAVLNVLTQEKGLVTITMPELKITFPLESSSALSGISVDPFYQKKKNKEAQMWDKDESIFRKRVRGNQIECFFNTVAAFLYSTPTQPPSMFGPRLIEIIQSSDLLTIISSYLRTSSMIDIVENVDLYMAILHLTCSIVSCPILASISAESVAIYLPQLRENLLQFTSILTKGLTVQDLPLLNEDTALLLEDVSFTENLLKSKGYVIDNYPPYRESIDHPSSETTGDNQLYCNVMKPLQLDSFKFIFNNRFTTNYNFEENVMASNGPTNPLQRKRLAEEAAQLTSFLSVSHPSIFIRFDTDRLDIIKVLIIGPTGTLFANGCFEFDIFFPPDYPTSPMLVFFVTTGAAGSKVRFHYHLPSNGKVKLSVLNTNGDSKQWNPRISLLDVLVYIQSLMQNNEPFFDNPGSHQIKGTPLGREKSLDYNANVRRATIKWAMLEQIKKPSPCFEHVIIKHFWLQRQNIEKQYSEWIKDMVENHSGTGSFSQSLGSLQTSYKLLKDKLPDLSPPPSPASTISAGGDALEEFESDEHSERNSELV